MVGSVDVSLPISPLDAQFFTDMDTVVETYMDHKVMNVQLKFCPGTKFKTIGSKSMVGWSHTLVNITMLLPSAYATEV